VNQLPGNPFIKTLQKVSSDGGHGTGDGKYFFGCQKFRHNQIMSLRSKSPETSKLTIIAFGDSITEGTYGGATIKETFPVVLEKQVLLVDHYKTWLQSHKEKSVLKAYLPDGAHPNAEGNSLLARVTYRALIKGIRKWRRS
jgi:lysophospholipase L1-like esterase